jgi:hypothetical protein
MLIITIIINDLFDFELSLQLKVTLSLKEQTRDLESNYIDNN